MLDMREFDFTCPFCGSNRITYVEPSKLQKVLSRSELMQNIFPGYDTTYREIFISKICSDCQKDAFKNPDEEDIKANYEIFDVEEHASEADKDRLRTNIIEMAENSSRY